MSQEGSASATGMTLAAIVIGLSITDELSANDQNIVANLLFAAAQAISTRRIPAAAGRRFLLRIRRPGGGKYRFERRPVTFRKIYRSGSAMGLSRADRPNLGRPRPFHPSAGAKQFLRGHPAQRYAL